MAQAPGAAGRAFTTREMIDLERDTIQVMRAGQRTQPALASGATRHDIEQAYPHLSPHQRAAVQHLLASEDQVVALEGVAGAGKTTALAAVRDGAEREGYRVEGFAPTSRAAQKLGEAGITSGTLQRHLAKRERLHQEQPRLYVLDESSLASTRQMHEFLHRLTPQDRVLLVGDVRQHQAVEAGRPYQQLQDAGIETVRLDDIVRQQDPALKHVVEQLSRGDVRDAVRHLEAQGRVHEIPERSERLTAIAREYARYPDGTLVVSPDNQELTGADRQWAQQYQRGDIVRYTRGSKVADLSAGEYARVDQVRAQDNRLTVIRTDGERVTYDPRRLQGVTVYREAERAFATGDRVQFTAPYREWHIANRELGTIEHIDAGGNLQLRLDAGGTIAFTVDAHPHLDYGYAVTSHSSQGQTADRVLVHVDTEHAGEQLVNRRLAYVAVSRGRYDAQIFTNDTGQLGETLSRDVSHRSAMEMSTAHESPAPKLEPATARRHEVQVTIGR